MSIREQLQADLKTAMKGGDKVSRTVIRGILTAIKETEQQKREGLVQKALKKHNVSRPQKQDAASMAAYNEAIDQAVAAEKVEDNSSLDEGEVLGIVLKLVKQQQDSINEAQGAGREDRVAELNVELEVLEKYLPQQLTREEIVSEAQAMIAQVGAGEPRDMGKVMGPLSAKLKGRADGRLISEVVKELLAQ